MFILVLCGWGFSPYGLGGLGFTSGYTCAPLLLAINPKFDGVGLGGLALYRCLRCILRAIITAEFDGMVDTLVTFYVTLSFLLHPPFWYVGP